MESTAKLLARRGSTTLSVTVERGPSVMPAALAALDARYDAAARTLHIEGLAPSDIARTLATLEASGYAIENVDFNRSTLQDVFLDLVRR
jgi:hypothetical protein